MTRRRIAGLVAVLLVAGLLVFAIGNPQQERVAVIVWICLFLWLSESVPPFVPTLLLLVAVPVLLGSFEPRFEFPAVLRWPADPVIALFLGGYALAAAARRHGMDSAIAMRTAKLSKGSGLALIGLVLAATAGMSMWMSNIAAAAMMFAALRPILRDHALDAPFRRAVLLAVAMGANFGGIATPIGTGPNGLAIAAAAPHPINFVHWMSFALPLTIGMLLATMVVLVSIFGPRFPAVWVPEVAPLWEPGAKHVALVFLVAVALWVTEPWHGLPAPLIALGIAAVLFGSGLLVKTDFGALDWSTLGLIAGGITMGRLLETSALFSPVAELVAASPAPPFLVLGFFLLASALLSAVMSNTATAAILIPIAMGFDPSPSTPILVAVASSLGVAFTISTPPNAMAYGEGGLGARDLLRVGLPLMLLGCAIVAVTGKPMLRLLGVP